MPTTLIIGGSGKVARHITKLLASQTPPPKIYSLIRNPAQAPDLESLGATPILQSIEESSLPDLVSTFTKYRPDTIIWSAGAGGGNPERTKAVDRDASIRAMTAAKESGFRGRYIVISALDVRDRENRAVPEWYSEADKALSERVWGAIGPYLRAKFDADRELVVGNRGKGDGLRYTIIRPGGLSQEAGTGKVSAGKVGLGSMVSREDVARCAVECIGLEETVGLAFDVVGGDVDVREAMERVGRERVDTFEGFY